MQILICDTHEDELRPATSKSLSIDGQLVELDLCSDCENRLLAVLGPYIRAARVVTGRSASTRAARMNHKPSAPPAVSPEGDAPPSSELDADQRRAIRNWAADQGIELYHRGRIAQAIVNDYFNDVPQRA